MANRSTNGYADNIETETLENSFFRKVLYTGPNMQLVVMTLQPGEDIGLETHDGHDQFFRVEEGEVTVRIGEEDVVIKEDEVAIVPSGMAHNVTNNSQTDVAKLYTIYAPPEHPDGRINETKPTE